MISAAVVGKNSSTHRLTDCNLWLASANLSGAEVDCITAVMLKILDGKCKMSAAEKVIMEGLYDCSRGLTGFALGKQYHQLIATARSSVSESILEVVYEKRVLAETQISRPVMKKFKARLRSEGILPVRFSAVGEDD